MPNEIDSNNVHNAIQAEIINGNVNFSSPRSSFVDQKQKAVDHLASAQARTRMGGIRTLGELGQDYPARRQTMVDMICDYLRLPFEESDRGEAEVRRTAQKVLADHLRPERNADGEASDPLFWPNMNVDLKGAKLIDANFSLCEFDSADFEDASFMGDTWFLGARFSDEARFVSATFDGWMTSFQRARFEKVSWFRWTTFNAEADFSQAHFGINAEFSRAHFKKSANFTYVSVAGCGWFTHNRFERGAYFNSATFKAANFIEVYFRDEADFRGATFTGAPPGCEAVHFNPDKDSNLYHWPSGWKRTCDEREPGSPGEGQPLRESRDTPQSPQLHDLARADDDESDR
ncbi:pentapeptide repeat-containing protein [Amycolatopsis sp. NPDC004747]